MSVRDGALVDGPAIYIRFEGKGKSKRNFCFGALVDFKIMAPDGRVVAGLVVVHYVDQALMVSDKEMGDVAENAIRDRFPRPDGWRMIAFDVWTRRLSSGAKNIEAGISNLADFESQNGGMYDIRFRQLFPVEKWKLPPLEKSVNKIGFRSYFVHEGSNKESVFDILSILVFTCDASEVGNVCVVRLVNAKDDLERDERTALTKSLLEKAGARNIVVRGEGLALIQCGLTPADLSEVITEKLANVNPRLPELWSRMRWMNASETL